MASSTPSRGIDSSQRHSSAVTSTKYPDYLAVPVTTLLPGVRVDFPIFAEMSGELFLFNRPGSEFSRDQRSSLVQAGHGLVFVALSDKERYYSYLSGSILQLLQEPGDADSEYLGRVCDLGTLVTRELLGSPEDPRAGAMAQDWISGTSFMFEARRGVLLSLVRVFDTSPDLFIHSMHTCLYGLALAREVGISDPTELGDLGIGLLLHDVGKTQLPDSIALGAERLTTPEWELAKTHPALGLDLVQGVEWIPGIGRDVIEHHHERPDGNGYPGSCSPSDLSVYARIATVANHFDSRSSNRLYRSAQPSMTVLKGMIQEGAGAFDVRILATFVRLLSS